MNIRLALAALLLLLGNSPAAFGQASTGLAPFHDDAGTPDPAVPVIDNDAVILCIGMSQANWECGGVPDVGSGGWVDQSTLPIVIVNGAVSGWEAERITESDANMNEYWNAVESRLNQAGYSNEDVQVMWGKNATRAVENNIDLIAERIVLRDALIEIQAEAERRFPNLRAGFHSSRVYGGHCRANPEPLAHETYLAIVGWDNEPGAIDNAPKWFLGPYIWADGTNARGDGLTWLREDFVSEPVSGPGCHPSQLGIDKVANQNNIFFSQLTYAPPGSSPPSAPTGLTATAVSSSQVDLAWTDNSNDETSFEVESDNGQGGAFSQIVATAANTTSHSHTGLSPNTEYCYRVRATGANGSSGYTAEVCATTSTAGGTPPAAPTGLTATMASDSQIDLSWMDQSSDEDSFRVERKTGQAGSFSEISATATDATSFSDTGLTSNTEYCYRVRARNASGDSAFSAESCATTDVASGTAPAAPSGLSAAAASDSQIDLSWTDESSDESSFRVERATGQGGTFAEIGSTAANAVTFNSSGLSASTEYCYRVKARNSAGDSAYTAVSCATTSAAPAPPPPPPPAGTNSSGGGSLAAWQLAFLMFVAVLWQYHARAQTALRTRRQA